MELAQRLSGLVGRPLPPGPWLTIDQDTIDRFAQATGDWQWIHTDPERARRESPFGSTVAHGMLTLSLAPGQAIELLELDSAPLVINYGFNRVRFPAPVPSSSRVRMSLTMAACEEVKGGMRLTLDLTFIAEGQERPVCVAQMLLQVME